MQNEILDSPIEEVKANKRPWPISLVAVVGIIAGTINLFGIFFLNLKNLELGEWFVPLELVSTLMALTCFMGYLLMRKWGVYAYVALVILYQGLAVILGLWTVWGFIFPAIFVAVGIYYLSKMT